MVMVSTKDQEAGSIGSVPDFMDDFLCDLGQLNLEQ